MTDIKSDAENTASGRNIIRISVDRFEGDTVICTDGCGNTLEFGRGTMPAASEGDLFDYNTADGSFTPLADETAAASAEVKRRLGNLFLRGRKEQ